VVGGRSAFLIRIGRNGSCAELSDPIHGYSLTDGLRSRERTQKDASYKLYGPTIRERLTGWLRGHLCREILEPGQRGLPADWGVRRKRTIGSNSGGRGQGIWRVLNRNTQEIKIDYRLRRHQSKARASVGKEPLTIRSPISTTNSNSAAGGYVDRGEEALRGGKVQFYSLIAAADKGLGRHEFRCKRGADSRTKSDNREVLTNSRSCRVQGTPGSSRLRR